jgi:hypothetical protein
MYLRQADKLSSRLTQSKGLSLATNGVNNDVVATTIPQDGLGRISVIDIYYQYDYGQCTCAAAHCMAFSTAFACAVLMHISQSV